MFHRGSRGSRRRSGPRPFVKTFKKVLNTGQVSVTSGLNTEVLALGVDTIAPSQTTVNDPNVPTGTRIQYFEIQFVAVNLTAGACFINCSVQYLLSTQAVLDPNLAGGHPQRNQILHMEMFSAGPDQNSNHKFRFKVPPKYQRMREGMQWVLAWNNSATCTRIVQTIYKMQN